MNLSAIFSSLVAIAKADAAKAILPSLAAFFNSIATNPTEINIVAQLAQLQVSVMAALPGIAQDELKAIASLLSAEATALLAPKATA